jgi:hypothetical protein
MISAGFARFGTNSTHAMLKIDCSDCVNSLPCPVVDGE